MYKEMFRFERFELWLEKEYPDDILTYALKGKRLELYPSYYMSYLMSFKVPDAFFAIIYFSVPSARAKKMYDHSLKYLRNKLQERFLELWPKYYAYAKHKKMDRKMYKLQMKKKRL